MKKTNGWRDILLSYRACNVVVIVTKYATQMKTKLYYIIDISNISKSRSSSSVFHILL